MCTVCARNKCVTSIQVIKTIQYIKIWAYCHKVYEDLFERKIQYYSPSTNRESSNISQGRYLVISAFRKMTIEDFFLHISRVSQVSAKDSKHNTI